MAAEDAEYGPADQGRLEHRRCTVIHQIPPATSPREAPRARASARICSEIARSATPTARNRPATKPAGQASRWRGSAAEPLQPDPGQQGIDEGRRQRHSEPGRLGAAPPTHHEPGRRATARPPRPSTGRRSGRRPPDVPPTDLEAALRDLVADRRVEQPQQSPRRSTLPDSSSGAR